MLHPIRPAHTHARPHTGVLITVDGTGPGDITEYDNEMRDSFISRIHEQTPIPRKARHRGPDWKGFGSRLVRPAAIAHQAKTLLAAAGGGPLFLAGYSRGGAIVTDAAAILQLEKIHVEAMFLFDAVDRSILLSGATVPANVAHCYHALRDPATRSRDSFGNCALRRENGKRFDGVSRFYTTHGGMGGTPWGEKSVSAGHIVETFPDGLTRVTPAWEAHGMEQARSWMWTHLRRHGVLP